MASWVMSVPTAVQRAPCRANVQPSNGCRGRMRMVGGWGVVCGHLSCVSFFHPSPLTAQHEGSHLPVASHLRFARASVTLCTLSLSITHPPLPLHTGWNHAGIYSWPSLAFSLFSNTYKLQFLSVIIYLCTCCPHYYVHFRNIAV